MRDARTVRSESGSCRVRSGKYKRRRRLVPASTLSLLVTWFCSPLTASSLEWLTVNSTSTSMPTSSTYAMMIPVRDGYTNPHTQPGFAPPSSALIGSLALNSTSSATLRYDGASNTTSYYELLLRAPIWRTSSSASRYLQGRIDIYASR